MPLASRARVPGALLALAALLVLAGCPPPAPRRPPPPPATGTGYVEWILHQAWDLSDLPAVAASFDQLCGRVAQGEEASRPLLVRAGTSLWLIETLVLPVLRALPDAEDLPPAGQLETHCAPVPDEALAEAARDVVAGDDLAHAVERLVRIEYGAAAPGVADDARLARAALAVARLLPVADVGTGPALHDAVAILDPDDNLLVPAARVGGPCDAAADSPACLWERLAAQALHDTSGAAAVDRSRLAPQAVGALARHGLLDLVARVLLPLAEDQGSNVRRIAAELVARLGRGLGIDQPQAAPGGTGEEQSWPEGAP